MLVESKVHRILFIHIIHYQSEQAWVTRGKKIMTHNRSQKQAIRNRMEETGESYGVALRKLQDIEEKNAVLYDLGDETDAWFVEGTTSSFIAKKMICDWVDKAMAPPRGKNARGGAWGGYWTPERIKREEENIREICDAVNSDTTKVISGNDFFWKAIYPEYPNEEATIEQVSKDPEKHNGEKLMVGTLVYL